jgi:hypothetical protein
MSPETGQIGGVRRRHPVFATHLHPDQIAALEQRIANLETSLTEARRLLTNLQAPPAPSTPVSTGETPRPEHTGTDQTGTDQTGNDQTSADQTCAMAAAHPQITHESPAADKIALLRSLITGRTDVYATRWTSSKAGKSGWSPTSSP